MAAHGFPRATMDIDIWVNPTALNADRVIQALLQFGAPTEQISQNDLATPGTIFLIGVAPRRIDLLTSIDAVSFYEAASDCERVFIDGLEIQILSTRHLIQNKQATGRLKDRADVETLMNSPGGT